MSFGTKILAVATTTPDLQATGPLLGNTTTLYSTNTDQGLEYDDTATTGTTIGDINLAFRVWDTTDAIRIITLAP